MIFDKPSTRTRVSFDVGMRELGGETIMLTGDEMQLGRGETIADTARVLSRYVDAIMIRILDHEDLRELARLRHRAGHQRPDQALASLPDHGRRADLRGASRPDQGRAPSPGRGDAQQRAGELGSCRRALRFLAATSRRRRNSRPPQVARRLGEDQGRAAHAHQRSLRGGRRAPIASSPTAGCRWATRKKRAAGTTCSRPIR